MNVCRVFTGSDGRTHFEDLDPSSHPALLAVLAASGVYWKEFPAGADLGWHPAPRRQVVSHLEGILEIEVGDGEARRFSKGDVRWMEDTSGRGHVTRVVSSEAVLLLVVPLVPDR